MKLITNVGGRAGIDCGGFCRFCFYKRLNYDDLKSLQIGCVNCPPGQLGCDECWKPALRIKDEFKPLHKIFSELENKLAIYSIVNGDLKGVKVLVTGGADALNHPRLNELLSIIQNSGYPIHLGYTSGKTIKDRSLADELISRGLEQLNFSVFSTNPELRKKWVRDKNTVESIEALKLFCENIEVNVSTIVIPGVNEEEQIFQTVSDLEEWGANSIVLRRLANFKQQGLILNDDKPIVKDVSIQSFEQYKELVDKVNDEFSIEVMSFPFYSPKLDFPFAISKRKNREFLDYLPAIKSEATVITGGIAGPYIEEIFNQVDEEGMVNVVTLKKEIADLITHEDLESTDLDEIKKRVVLPYGALVKDDQAEGILSSDGISRKVVRGPKVLTHPYYEDVSFNQEELIRYELKSFSDLINKINQV